ncbi:uncharacterized protein LOC129722483 [Wyeomyia smithii]|uniref:uncharacterized protein LOC129722483 n=1 Tax=Wyeomyia smithii TaxID=174621 RepID=UPI002467FEA6|nr:uncharacterized protein LOC129722483 [Wyeomyia smithii]
MLYSTLSFAVTQTVLLCILVIMNHRIDPTAAQGQRLCGKILVSTLSMMCDEFPTLPPPHYNKRFNDDQSTPVNDRTYFGERPNVAELNDNFGQFKITRHWMIRFPKFGDRRDLSLKHHQVVKRGIFEECCLKPCTENQLRTFCAKVSSKR